MNVLFVNYGDFTTNSLNHIGGFANALSASGHACAVAIRGDLKTLSIVASPFFIPTTYDAALAKPALFPDGRCADIVHAWTPRECVREFVLAYQRHAQARVVIHLEDNEEFLLARWLGETPETLATIEERALRERLTKALSHPRRYPHFLQAADGVTVIVESLREFVPAGVTTELLPPGVDFHLYQAAPADAALRRELNLKDEEKVIVFTGSNTFANESEMRELYLAVALLNTRGTPTRLLRTGFNSPEFQASLPEHVRQFVTDLGFVEKARLPRLLALADVLVQPGQAGPFNDYRLPSKLPEFLSAGRPVVLPATNIGRLLRDGEDAVLLRQGTPEEIADACERIFNHPELAAKLARNAVVVARREFDLERNTRRLAGFYEKLKTSPARAGSLSGAAPASTELSLALDRVAATSSDPAAAAVARSLSPLIASLEDLDAARAERRRLEKDAEEWRKNFELARQHAANFEEQFRNADQKLSLTTQHIDNVTRELTQSRQHAENVTREINETRRHAENLTRELNDARGRLKRLEGKYAISEKLLSSTRRQLESLDQELGTARRQFAQLREEQRMTQQHAANLETLRDSLQQRVQELDQQCHRLVDIITQRDDAIKQRDAKIRAMQRSFSWQVTSPLRWLRRVFLDPKRPRPNAVTAPVERPAVTTTATLSGKNGHSDQAGTNGNALSGSQGPSRSHEVVPGFVCSVDNPQSWSLAPRKVVIRGWCFTDDGRKLKAVRAIFPERTVEGVYGFKRLDVLASFRGKPQAEYCGWKLEVELTPADNWLDLEVADEHGAWQCFFHTALRVGEGFGPLDLTSYEKWAEAYDRHTTESLIAQSRHAANFAFQPLISIVMPVYNTPERWLRRAVDSVRAQSYAKWELCIADDASPEPHVRQVLEALAREDERIKFVRREQNGHISAASNSALELATGEFVGLLDHDDELSPNALFEVVSALNVQPDADYLYSDEDKIDEEGRRFEPYFKPDWQPDLFLGQNYTSHFSVYRATLVRAVGGFRVGFEGSQDWDLALRVVEKTAAERIVHIPRVLYHWRAIPGSTALQLSEKNYPVEAARRALVDHFARTGEPAELVPVPGDHWRVKRPVPTPAPLVSLLIPTRNGLKLLQRCVDSILAKTTYPNFEIVVVDNGSDDPAALAYLESLSAGTHPLLRPGHAARVLRYDAPFNYSAINNHAAREARGEIVGLLNNDLQVIHGDWLDEMASHAARPDIGCVGAMLYYPNDTIQHAGCVLGIGGVAGHAFREFPRGTEGKFNRARLIQNYSCVTAACLLVRKSVYEEVGGLDEQALAVAFNDIDFCLKVLDAGYRNLWTPFAELYHHESASRGADDTPEKAERFQNEVETMLRRWGPALKNDPAYNPNLTLELNDFSLASPPRPASPRVVERSRVASVAATATA